MTEPTRGATRRIPTHVGGLGRHVEHDERSRLYAYRRTLTIQTVYYTSHIGVLDQGGLGSCTGNAAVGCLGYEPFWSTLPQDGFELTEDLAVAVYSDATRLDAWPGEYPPDDTGSSGLAAAKALQQRGLIAGYLHAFTLTDALGALMERPLICGTNWYATMSSPDAEGIVRPGGPIVGGHEYVMDGFDNSRGLVSFRNSWGGDWGLAGRFYMSTETLTRLLAEDGDATVFVPVTQPAPVPVPPAPEPAGCLGWLVGR